MSSRRMFCLGVYIRVLFSSFTDPLRPEREHLCHNRMLAQQKQGMREVKSMDCNWE